MALRNWVLALGAMLCVACVDPLEEDTPGYGAHLLPPGTELPEFTEDPMLVTQIDRNDGLPTKLVPRLNGFAEGSQVFYWDFGVSPRNVTPIFRFMRRTSEPGVEPETFEPVDHPDLVDAIPGDSTYSPFHGLFNVVVTDKWKGEVITTLAALDDAIELGLVEDPISLLDYADYPFVQADQQLEVAREGMMPVYEYPQGRAIYQGTIFHYFKLTGTVHSGVSSRAQNVHILTRDGDSLPLSEPARPGDLNGDMDTLDTNNIFAVGPSNTMYYSPLSVLVNTIVPRDYVFGTHKAETDMFDVTVTMMGRTVVWTIRKKPGAIVGFTTTTTNRNLPIQRVAGQP